MRTPPRVLEEERRPERDRDLERLLRCGDWLAGDLLEDEGGAPLWRLVDLEALLRADEAGRRGEDLEGVAPFSAPSTGLRLLVRSDLRTAAPPEGVADSDSFLGEGKCC